MTLRVIGADGALRPYFPRPLHVYSELASDFLTDAKIRLPLYFLSVKRTDELERVATFAPFLNHSKAMIGPLCSDASHSNAACFPFSTVTLL